MATRQWHEGHSSTILCVGAAGGPEGVLATGSEGGEVTLWNQEGTILGHLTLPGEDDTTSVVFSPAPSGLLYVSHGETVSVLDPRNLKGVVKQFQSAGEEEINSMAINDEGSFLAVADDSGAVRILEVSEGRICRTLRRHTNICSSVTFRPKRPNNLVSAGLDMQVILWSQQKTRPLWTINLQEVTEEENDHQQKPGQLFNPPLAHCVSVASCGNIVACAAEDGRLHLMRVGSGSKLEQHGLFKAHSQGVSQAHFVSGLSHPYWLATGGNDGQVALWDLSQNPVVALEGNTKPGGPAAHQRKNKGRTKTKHLSKGKAKASSKGSTNEEGEGEPDNKEELGAMGDNTDRLPNPDEEFKSGPSLCFNHGDKVNWVCPVLLKGEPTLVVADQSSSLTVYPLSGV